MRIHSTLALLDGPRLFLVMDTFAGQRHFVTAIVQSPDGGQRLSELGQQVLDAALGYHETQQHQGIGVHHVPVLAQSTARQRALQVLSQAEDHALVVFFGANDAICAQLMRVLGLSQAGGRGAFPVQ